MSQKPTYVFIAWGIGITPFRSIIKNLLDSNKKEPITLFYIAAKHNEYLFKDILAEADKKFGLQTIYVENKTILEETFLTQYIADIQTVLFYLSGPQEKVEKQRELLMNAGISNAHIKTDLFTGYA